MIDAELIDLGTAEGRAKVEAYKRAQSEKVVRGQQLYAKIKRGSEYYDQGERGALFPVFVEEKVGGYVVQGGPGGQYRLQDVSLFVVDQSTGKALRISQ